MTFAKYNLRDNAFATLDAKIGASTTTITLTLGQGVRFPTSNAILTLVQYNTLGDPSSGVLKREKVLLTSRSSDILTVTRGFDGDTETVFEAGDFIYLNVVSEVIEDIQDEVERLESDKLNKVGATRTGLTPYRLLYIDSTGAETELALGTAGQTLISQGATSNPVWQVPSVDIAGLTEDEVGNMENDEFVKRDATGNKKIKLTRYRATDAEATAGTSTTKFVTPAQAVLSAQTTEAITKTTATSSGSNPGSDVTSSIFAEDRDLIISVDVNLRIGTSSSNAFTRYFFEVSDDNTNWTTIDSNNIGPIGTAEDYEAYTYILKKGKYARGRAETALNPTLSRVTLRHQKA